MQTEKTEKTEKYENAGNKHHFPVRPMIFGLALAAVLAMSVYVIAAFVFDRDAQPPSSALSAAQSVPAETTADSAVSANLAPPTLPATYPQRANSAVSSPLDNMVFSGAIYIMLSRDNKICVYSADMSTLYGQLDTYVSTLPEADQQLLAAGIRITSQQQLNQLIEAYEN